MNFKSYRSSFDNFNSNLNANYTNYRNRFRDNVSSRYNQYGSYYREASKRKRLTILTIFMFLMIIGLTIAYFVVKLRPSKPKNYHLEEDTEFLRKANQPKEYVEEGDDYFKHGLKENIGNGTYKEFMIERSDVPTLYLNHFWTLSRKNQLREFNNPISSKNYSFLLGDLNDDGLEDLILSYRMIPNIAKGDSVIRKPIILGMAAFTNTGERLVLAAHTEEFGKNRLIKIKEGIIYCEGKEYTDEDEPGNPTVTVPRKLILEDNKLVKSK